MRLLTLLTAATALATGGCVTSWSAAELSAASGMQLCDTFAFELALKNLYRTDLMDEITRRKLIRPEYQSAVNAGEAKVGMSEIEAVCAWAAPSRVNTTTTAAGIGEQWVWQRGGAIGRPTFKYLYFRNGYVTTMQTSQ